MKTGDLRWVFQMFDQNGDRKITKKELSDSLENLGIVMAVQDRKLIKP